MQDFSSSSIHKYILIDRCNQFNCIIIFWPWPYYQTLMLLFLIFWIKISFIDAIEEFLLNFKPWDTSRYMHDCEQLNSNIYFFYLSHVLDLTGPHFERKSFKDFAQDILLIHVFNFIIFWPWLFIWPYPCAFLFCINLNLEIHLTYHQYFWVSTTVWSSLLVNRLCKIDW